MTSYLRRRKFITLLGSAAATWPMATRAQQSPMSVVGFLSPVPAEALANRIQKFRDGLKEAGFIEGDNVSVLYRNSENDLARLPVLAADLVRRKVSVIAAVGHEPSFAAKAATATTNIPMVFAVAEDPVRIGLVKSLARPEGNVTGVNFFAVELGAKRLALLRELVPGATRIAVLVNPANPTNTDNILKEIDEGAHTLGMQIEVLKASSSRDIDLAFARLAGERPDALFVASGAFMTGRRVQIANLASRYGIPATYSSRENAEAGGLMSYGTDIADAYRQLGAYAGRILKGEKPADLPVVQSSKFELVINLPTARMLNLTVPASLLAVADEVIE